MLRAIRRECGTGPDADADKAKNPGTYNDDCDMQKLINGISLNNIRVVVGGAMTVDVATIPATVYSVSFDTTDLTKLWGTIGTDESGTIAGVYLTGGVPSAVDNAGNPIPGITMKALPDGSSDTVLHFTMNLSKCISPGTPISIVVTKPQDSSSMQGGTDGAKQATTTKPGVSVASTPFQLQQQPIGACPPTAVADSPAAPAAKGLPTVKPATKVISPQDATPKPD
jgi:hypothetical protein